MKSWKPGHAVFDYDLPQLRMQALQMTKTSIGTDQIAYNFELADKFVHYFMTGERQLPEKKDALAKGR